MKKSTKNQHVSSDSAFLEKLIVGIGEVAQITGIPQRQLRYWEDKGIIQCVAESHARRFNYLEIKKILLIKELLDEGYTLEAAAKKVEQRMEFINSAFDKLKSKRKK